MGRELPLFGAIWHYLVLFIAIYRYFGVLVLVIKGLGLSFHHNHLDAPLRRASIQ